MTYTETELLVEVDTLRARVAALELKLSDLKSVVQDNQRWNRRAGW